ncbi:hypothetical protein DVH24_032176 [Malus domestica]|uniref:Uncharacterized protein n=1 Tax=Malus domestica TaxID=3750 RepID=A0A498J251_MALDO|nr:hypothetical protein DVH24_032176 [Malus domestica]
MFERLPGIPASKSLEFHGSIRHERRPNNGKSEWVLFVSLRAVERWWWRRFLSQEFAVKSPGKLAQEKGRGRRKGKEGRFRETEWVRVMGW